MILKICKNHQHLRTYENFEIGAVHKYVDVVDIEKIMLKNAYLGMKIGFDIEENELSEVGCAAGYQLYFYLAPSSFILRVHNSDVTDEETRQGCT